MELNEQQKMADRIASLERQVEALQQCVSTLLQIQGTAIVSEIRGFKNKMNRLQDEGAELATIQEKLLEAFVVKSD